MANQPGASPYREFVLSDLFGIVVLGLFLIVTGLGLVGEFPGRTVAGLVAVLFAPGYALVAALFPYRNSSSGLFEDIRAEVTGDGSNVTVVERLLLSVGLSVCIVPLLGLAIEFTQLEIRTPVFLGAIGVTTILLTIFAAIRRQQVPDWQRFNPQLDAVLRSVSDKMSMLGAASNLTLILVVGFVVAGAGIGVAVLDAERGEQFTEFSLLTEDPETGELVADGYPEEIPQGESESVYLGITNNEGEQMDYTVITLLQSFDKDGQLQEVETLNEDRMTLDYGDTVREQQSISPEMTGEDLRVTYLLYAGSPPQNEPPRTDNAYRSVHIWIDVPS